MYIFGDIGTRLGCLEDAGDGFRETPKLLDDGFGGGLVLVTGVLPPELLF